MARQRSIITPEHFVVAPELLGLPLASPGRRAWAMAIDGLLIVLLVKSGGVLLGVVAAALLFRAASPDPRSGSVKRYVRTILRVAGAIVLFIVVLKAFDSVRDRLAAKQQPPAPTKNSADTATGNANLHLSGGQLASLAGPLLTLRRAEDSAQVEQAATQLLEAMRSTGASDSDLEEARDGLVQALKNKAPSRVGAVNNALHRIVGEPQTIAPDSVMQRYLAAVAAHDSTAARGYRDSIKSALAGRDLASLNRSVSRLRSRSDSLQDEVEKARKAHGIRSFLAGAADDLGVGFGWSAVYFTAFFALWRGQTPGKKLAGLRVIRLDGEPLGWWLSFERFGGYAASFSVGLMGFLQILWDRNRQGLHDKACETVVVRTASLSRVADRTAAPAQAAPYRPK